jgi:flavin reductase
VHSEPPGGPLTGRAVPTAVALEAPFSTRELRDTLGMFATGVTIITTRGPSEPYGMTANAFSAVSLDPPLVLVCVLSEAKGAAAIVANGHFAVNVLGARQEALSRHFAWPRRPRGPAAFAGVPHHCEVTGAPIIEGAAAYLDCWLASRHQAGDHTIFVGEVAARGADPHASPLVWFAGGYRSL